MEEEKVLAAAVTAWVSWALNSATSKETLNEASASLRDVFISSSAVRKPPTSCSRSSLLRPLLTDAILLSMVSVLISNVRVFLTRVSATALTSSSFSMSVSSSRSVVSDTRIPIVPTSFSLVASANHALLSMQTKTPVLLLKHGKFAFHCKHAIIRYSSLGLFILPNIRMSTILPVRCASCSSSMCSAITLRSSSQPPLPLSSRSSIKFKSLRS